MYVSSENLRSTVVSSLAIWWYFFFVLAPMWRRVGSKQRGDSQALRTRAGNGCYAVSLTSSNEKRGGSPNELQHGKLWAFAVVSECQNRPSGETSHSNWWLCIRQMHFYRVIHLSLSFLPLFLAAMFPYCHYSLLPYHRSPTIFIFYFSFIHLYPGFLSLLPASCVLNICQKNWAIK